MIFHLVSVFVAAIAAAGCVVLVYRLIGRKPPKYMLPAAAAAAMFFVNIYAEYNWFYTTRDGLPENIKVVQTFDKSVPWSPWTYLWPRIERFTAVDVASVKTNPSHPGYVVAETHLVQKGKETLTILHLFDCGQGRIAAVSPNTEFDETGLPKEDNWEPLNKAHPMMAAVCG